MILPFPDSDYGVRFPLSGFRISDFGFLTRSNSNILIRLWSGMCSRCNGPKQLLSQTSWTHPRMSVFALSWNSTFLDFKTWISFPYGYAHCSMQWWKRSDARCFIWPKKNHLCCKQMIIFVKMDSCQAASNITCERLSVDIWSSILRGTPGPYVSLCTSFEEASCVWIYNRSLFCIVCCLTEIIWAEPIECQILMNIYDKRMKNIILQHSIYVNWVTWRINGCKIIKL